MMDEMVVVVAGRGTEKLFYDSIRSASTVAFLSLRVEDDSFFYRNYHKLHSIFQRDGFCSGCVKLNSASHPISLFLTASKHDTTK